VENGSKEFEEGDRRKWRCSAPFSWKVVYGR